MFGERGEGDFEEDNMAIVVVVVAEEEWKLVSVADESAMLDSHSSTGISIIDDDTAIAVAVVAEEEWTVSVGGR